jgi:negative regulator of replication initiation
MSKKFDFPHKDKVLKVSLIDQDFQKDWSLMLFGRAVEAARAMKSLLTEDEYATLLKTLSNDYSIKGLYAFKSKNNADFLASPHGRLTLAQRLFGVDEDTMLEIMLTQKAEVEAVLQLVQTESFPKELVVKAREMEEAGTEDAKKK